MIVRVSDVGSSRRASENVRNHFRITRQASPPASTLIRHAGNGNQLPERALLTDEGHRN